MSNAIVNGNGSNIVECESVDTPLTSAEQGKEIILRSREAQIASMFTVEACERLGRRTGTEEVMRRLFGDGELDDILSARARRKVALLAK